MSDFHLAKAGAVTGRRKNKYPGEIVYDFAAGSKEMLEFLNDNPECVIRPIDEVVDYMQISGTSVEYIATEYGLLNLRYKSNVERASHAIVHDFPSWCFVGPNLFGQISA